jgi:hypothetical protein
MRRNARAPVMILTDPRIRSFWIAAVLVAAGTERFARAQDDEEPLEAPQDALQARMEARREVLVQRLLGERADLERLTKATMSRRLDELKVSCQLTEAQVQKLTVAGNGEIKRFMDEIDQIGGDTAGVREDLGDIVRVERALRDVLLKRKELTREIDTGFLGEDSFFSKTLLRTLDQKQAASYQKALAEKIDQGSVLRKSMVQRELAHDQRLVQQELAEHQRLVQRHVAERRDRWTANIDNLLLRRLDELRGSCQLTEAQVKTLTIAGKSDVKRFLDRFDQIARKIGASRTSQNDLRILLVEINDLENKVNGAFLGEDWLFSKTLARTLDREQAASYEQALAEKRRLQYEQAVSRAFRLMKRNLDLSDQQVQQLVQLLLRDTRPPKKFGRASDIALVLFQVSRLPKQTIKPMFDDAQWQRLSHWTAAYKDGAGGEQVLMRNGFIFDDKPEVGRPVPAEPGKKPKEDAG